jgi:YgiT-type zinc finger domain-containing protein
MSDDRSEHFEYPCPSCAGGRRSLHHITYFAWLRNQLVTVPNFPAWICDLCGARDYDSRAVSWLNTILNSQDHGRDRRPMAGPPASTG